MLRYGQLYAAAVLRPLAEQLVDALAIRSGDVVCDVLCDGGELARACAPAVGAGGRVIAADTDAELATSAARSVQAFGVACSMLLLDASPPPRPDLCDRVACLLTGGFKRDPVAAMRGLTRPHGRALIACWDAESPPPHEAALRAALQQCGIVSAYLNAVMFAPPAGRTTTPVRDVVRFDGFALCWAALVEQRPLAAELAAQPPETVSVVKTAYQQALREYEAVDGTLRIPVSASFVEL